MALNRNRMKMGNRYQQQFDSRDDGGTQSSGVIAWGKAPKRKFFKPNLEGRNKINILPYEIKSKNHPEVVAGRAKVGDADFVLDVWVHRSVGPDKVDILCPKRTYGKRCPICEESGKLYDANQTEEGKSLKASRRVFYNFQEIGKDGPSKEVTVHHVSHYLFAKELMEEANACANGNSVIPFADLDDGKIVSFRANEEKGKGGKMVEYKSFQFLDRDEEISDAILEQCISFDEFLIVPTPEQLEAALYGAPAEEGAGGDPAPKETPSPWPNREPEADPEDTPPPRRTREPEPEPEDAPPPRRTRPVEDIPSKPACPSGHDYGADCDKKPACARCPDATYEACRKHK